MKKTIFILVLTLAIILSGCAKSKVEGKTNITTTLFPLFDFTKIIAGDKAEVILLLPPGVEPHSFEPTPSDVAKINESDIFIYTGKFMESWAHDITKGLNEKVKVVEASDGIKMMKVDNDHDHNDQQGVDPHIWLDFNNAEIIVLNIEKALSGIDPENAEYYAENAQKYIQELRKLDGLYNETLDICETKTIVYGGHYAFGYMAERYGLEYKSAQGFSPDSEPSAKDLAEMINQIKNEDIRYIFYEELTSPKIAETLSKESNARMLELNAAHNIKKEDYQNGTTYISIMKGNLENLKTGLNCKQ